MEKRNPVSIDIGDAKKRAIWFSANYAKKLREKHGSLNAFLQVALLEVLIPDVVFEGLVDRGDLTAETFGDIYDASLQKEHMQIVFEALTGIKQDLKITAVEGDAKNETTPPVQ